MATPRSLTDHPGYWYNDPRPTPKFPSTPSTSSVPPPQQVSFHLSPNPSVWSSASSKLALLPDWTTQTWTLVVGGSGLACVLLWKLYQRWHAHPDAASLKHRQKLKTKFKSLPSEQKTPGGLWSWIFGSSSSPTSTTPPTSPSKRKKKSSRSSHSASPPLSRSSSAQSDSSSTVPLTGSERFRVFLDECKQLAITHQIIISNPTEFYLKRERMRESNLEAMKLSESGCESNIHLLCTFDRTLTTLKQPSTVAAPHYLTTPSLAPVQPPLTARTSQSMIHDFLPPAYEAAMNALFNLYHPQQDSPHITPEVKDRYMREWWSKTHALLCLDEYRLTRNKLRHMVQTTLEQRRITLRGGVLDLLHQSSSTGETGGLCERYDLPVVIVSGTIHDCIEELLLQHDIRTWNSNANLSLMSEADRRRHEQSRVIIVANRVQWSAPVNVNDLTPPMPSALDAATASPNNLLMRRASHLHTSSTSTVAGVCLGFDHAHLVHSLNKTYHQINDQPHILAKVANKSNLILLGNTLADGSLADGWEVNQQQSSSEYAPDASFIQVPSHGHTIQQPHPSHPITSSFIHSPQQHHSPNDLSASYYHVPESFTATSPSSTTLYSPVHSSHSTSPTAPGGEILRIGFLNENITQERLHSFSQVYDVVICNDADMTFVKHLLEYLCGEHSKEALIPK